MVILDCTDLRCPQPVIELAKAIPGVGIGDVIGVMALDPAARTDIPAWCRMRGHDYLGEETAESGTPIHVVRRVA